jgi:hypothetical protein
VTALINEVAGQPDADEALLLILDDHHPVSSQLVPGSFGFLLEHQPPGLQLGHLVLLSHRDGARVMAGTYVAEPNTILLGNMVIEILQAAGLPPDQAGWAAFAAFHYVLGHTIEEQAQIELAERGAWEPKLTVDGIENKLAATAFTADPAEWFGYGLQLFLDGIRQQLA